MELTTDRLLGQRIILSQPKSGYRVGSDAILLAASIPANNGQTVLDVGAGVGAVALCLATRMTGIKVYGLELQIKLAQLASENGAINNLTDRVQFLCGDIHKPPEEINRTIFDHTACNPPFYTEGRASLSPDPGKALAHSEKGTPLSEWLNFCLRRTRPGGTVTVIHRTARLHDILSEWKKGAGDMTVIPLWSKPNHPAKRVIVQAKVGSNGPVILHPGIRLHDEDGSNSEKAQAILSGGAALDLTI